jgi:hypothetical protein
MVFTNSKINAVLKDKSIIKPKPETSFYFTHYSMFDRLKDSQGCKTCGRK